MNILIGYKILPVKAVNGIFDTSIIIPQMDTPEKKYAYLLSKVLCNKDLLRMIFSFL